MENATDSRFCRGKSGTGMISLTALVWAIQLELGASPAGTNNPPKYLMKWRSGDFVRQFQCSIRLVK